MRVRATAAVHDRRHQPPAQSSQDLSGETALLGDELLLLQTLLLLTWLFLRLRIDNENNKHSLL